MDKFDFQLLIELQHMDRIRSNYFVQRKFRILDEIDEVEYVLAYSRLRILDREDLIDELKKQHFLKIIRIHPDTKKIKLSRVLMYWETIQNNAN